MGEWGFLVSLLVAASVLGLAALGGLFSERSGIVNIGLEGKMLVSAAVGAMVGLWSGQAWIGLLAGIAASVVLSLLHYALTQVYQIDGIVAGIGINLLSAGAANFIAQRFIEPGKALALFPPLLFVGFFVVSVVTTLLYVQRTRGGLRLFAVGNDPGKARESGVNPAEVRLHAMIVCGVLCGLSGALALANSGTFQDRLIAGRGFIALAALILGGWRPVPAAVAAVAFATVEALQVQLQGRPVLGIDLPSEFWISLPYVACLVALAGLLGRTKAPSGLGKV